jgi:hypothetical protein
MFHDGSMTDGVSRDPDTGAETIRLEQLHPYWTVTVLECTDGDADAAFAALGDFLLRCAEDPGRALGIRTTGSISVARTSTENGSGEGELLTRFGFDWLFGLTRERRTRPEWAAADAPLVDVSNELALALGRQRLVAVRTFAERPLLQWVDSGAAPYRRVPADVMSATFGGDGKALWLQGVHRRRAAKPDAKSLHGVRLQEAMDAVEDATFAMSAMKIDYVSDVDRAVLNGTLTINPARSHLSFKAMSSFLLYLAATAEALDMVDKSLTEDDAFDQPFPELAVRETDLDKVRDAFDVRVADPDEIRGLPDADDGDVERAEMLQDVLLGVIGEPGSAAFVLDVGTHGSVAGRLKVKPVRTPRGPIELDVRYAEPPTAELIARRIKDIIGTGDLISVYYESGHVVANGEITRQNLKSAPFPNYEFEDFSGTAVTEEKPRVLGVQKIHDAIGANGDRSLFGWVVRRYRTGWLLCDDGPGEAADFLHLDDDGTLTALHLKGAQSRSPGRRVAVQAYEQVASQAAKNARLLASDPLAERLAGRTIERPGLWYDGQRTYALDDFLFALRTRKASDPTRVVIVQPHLLRSVHDAARAAADNGRPTSDSHSLALLDVLLHGTRRTVAALWDDLTVVGCC